MKENKEYEITKSSRNDWIGVTFQCHIINRGVNVAPKWFREFEKKNDARWAENDARWARQEEFNKYVGGFIRKQEEFNKRVSDFIQQQLEFNKHVIDVFKRNNLK
ncbi:MAG: hypothetical protein LBG49_03285 [Mycoplasmataceae bacterium]|nr:hypothetical protein [Mycoplasmataceae bacterium]